MIEVMKCFGGSSAARFLLGMQILLRDSFAVICEVFGTLDEELGLRRRLTPH